MTNLSELVIRSIRAEERAAWQPLWHDYLTFYESQVSPETTDILWQRFHDPNEPMFVLGAFSDDRLVGIVQYLFHRSCGPSATIATCRICSLHRERAG